MNPPFPKRRKSFLKRGMALFPSPLERTVASALLLLSNSHSICSVDESVSLEEKIACKSCSDEEHLSLFSTSSKSKSSSIISDGSSKENRARKKLRFVTSAARFREMKFKVTRKRSSIVWWSTSDDRKTVIAPPPSFTSKLEPAEDSCISSTTTAASSHSVTKRMQKHRLEPQEKIKRTKSNSISGSSHLRYQADDILKLLSGGCSSEVRIRQLLGDTPDTSKALRMLLKKEKIKRTGMGGRSDPYIYKIA